FGITVMDDHRRMAGTKGKGAAHVETGRARGQPVQRRAIIRNARLFDQAGNGTGKLLCDHRPAPARITFAIWKIIPGVLGSPYPAKEEAGPISFIDAETGRTGKSRPRRIM